MTQFMMDLDKVRILALNKGLSISGLCIEAGLSRSRGTDWGKRAVRASTVFKVARVLGVEPLEIVKEASNVE